MRLQRDRSVTQSMFPLPSTTTAGTADFLAGDIETREMGGWGGWMDRVGRWDFNVSTKTHFNFYMLVVSRRWNVNFEINSRINTK